MQPGDAGELSGPVQVGPLSAKARLLAQGSFLEAPRVVASLCHPAVRHWGPRVVVQALCGRHCLGIGGVWLELSSWHNSSKAGRTAITHPPTTVDDPLNSTPAFLRFRTWQEWLPYRPPCGHPPRSPGKHCNRGRYQMSQLRARGSPFFESRAEGQSGVLPRLTSVYADEMLF